MRSLREAWFGELFGKVQALAVSSLLVLLLACVNGSSLLWARTVERRREIALRSALGATRRRLVRRLLMESLVLAFASSLLALVFMHWTLDWMIASNSLELRGFVAVGTGPAVIAGTLALGLATSLGFGLAPALGGTRLDLCRELAEGGGRGVPRWRWLDALIVVEVTLAFVLLYGAFHAEGRFQHLAETDPGYRTDRLVTLRVNLWGHRYASREARIGVADRMLSELRGTPEVEAVALVSPYMPSDEIWQTQRMTVENRSGDPDSSSFYVQTHRVSTGYFETMEIDLLEGRPFQPTDAVSGGLVVVVSAAAARRGWPGESPLGRRLKPGAPDAEGPVFTVIGMVGDLAESGFGRASNHPHLYLYMSQAPPYFPPTVNVLLRTVREPDEELIGRLREAVTTVVPDLPAYDVRTLEQRLEAQLAGDRFLLRLVALFTVLALVLSAAGIYALASHRLASRTRELAVRLALGCTHAGLFRRVLGQSLGLALSGVAAGSALTLAALRVLESRLEEASPEPALLVGVATLLVGVSLAATVWSAWQAARLDPMATLREE